MKKYFLLILSVASLTAAKAQVSKGMMTIGGEVSVQNTSFTGGGSSSSTLFSPSFGYFLSDKVALGAAVGIANTSVTGSASTSTTSFTPFVRFYKSTAEEKFAFFVQGGVGYSSSTGQNSVVSLSVRPGFAYFFTSHWGLDFVLPGLVYSNGNNTSTFDLTASLTPGLGFRYYFGK